MHLLFPDEFERIASDRQKHQIVNAFRKYAGPRQVSILEAKSKLSDSTTSIRLAKNRKLKETLNLSTLRRERKGCVIVCGF